MNWLAKPAFGVCILVTSLVFTPAKSLAMTTEAKDLYLQGVAAANDNAWPLALEYFNRAHQLARSEASIYYALAAAHDKCGNALPGMAWYVAYIAAKTEPEKATFARDRIGKLELAVRHKLLTIFASAEAIAKVSGSRYANFWALASVAQWEQAAGLIEAATATRQVMFDAYGKEMPSQQEQDDPFLVSLKHTGGIEAMRRVPGLGLGDGYIRERELLGITEIRHFVYVSDPLSRVRLAEIVSRNDPLVNIDLKLTAALEKRTADEEATKVIARINSLGYKIGMALMQICALTPSPDEHYLSSDAQSYLRLALRCIRRPEQGVCPMLHLAYTEGSLFRQAWSAGSFVSVKSGLERLALYRVVSQVATYFEETVDPSQLGLRGEEGTTSDGGFRSLVWTRVGQRGAWKLYREITVTDFAKGSKRKRWVSRVDAFGDEGNGLAILTVMEGGPPGTASAGSYKCSVRIWDLTNNKEKARKGATDCP